MLNWEKFIIASDSHGDVVDPTAIRVFKKFSKDWGAKYRLHLGDIWDLRALRKKADEEEKRQSILSDFQAGMKFLDWYKPTHVTLGNHDKRLWDLFQAKKGPLSDYAGLLVNKAEDLFRLNKTIVKPYRSDQGIIEIGHLKGVHGYVAGVNAARRTAQVYGSVFMGHGHGIQTANIEGLENRIGRMIGCLCDLYMDYGHANMGQLLHRHGFAYGVVNKKTGDFFSWQAESINGQWIIPSDVRLIK